GRGLLVVIEIGHSSHLVGCSLGRKRTRTKKVPEGGGTFPHKRRFDAGTGCALLWAAQTIMQNISELSPMNLAELIAPHIPYLRRFARSLTGSQASGDAYVAATLEALVSDRSVFPEDLDPRVALYQVFSRMWQSVDINIQDFPPAGDRWEEKARRNLSLIAP